MLSIVFALLALAQGALLLATWKVRARGFAPIYLRLLLLALALDNAIIALAPALWEAPVYVLMSTLRFWMHALLLPLLLVFVAALLAPSVTRVRAQQLWFGAWLLAAAAIMYGYVYDLANLRLVVADVYPRMVGADSQLPLATIVVNLLVLPAGVWLWRRRSWPWLFVGALSIFLVNGASAGSAWGFVAGNCVELMFALSLLATLWRFAPGVKPDQAGEVASTRVP